MSISLGNVQGSDGYMDPSLLSLPPKKMASSEYADYIENQVNEGKMTWEEGINSLAEKLKQYTINSIDYCITARAMVKLEDKFGNSAELEFQNKVQELSNQGLEEYLNRLIIMKDEGRNVDQSIEIVKAEQERRKAESAMTLFSKS